MKQPTLKNNTAETDILIGSRIRHFRQTRGMSQEALAAKLGVTFQQQQKYEKGANRVSASALILICKALAITPNDILGSFFDDAPSSIAGQLAEENVALKSTLSEIRRIAA
ncbi:helix-turn-helix transcriptional regulator [Sinorhizobium sp. 8-89]|uniref:helix-turn-helix domain-containing protein n=1 Tax=Sinorhizobium sp. 7-81 TaxID=3049087 RepID=UPI0024C44567|nr:helix-turn-helix transcriptional regulator [Sinorhizobium sp. 7-81]MDK1386338.1 helix-turn-helix transcriptional regulator [Sinorhizobium sp. 7-81]